MPDRRAIVNAFYDATGVRPHEAPFTRRVSGDPQQLPQESVVRAPNPKQLESGAFGPPSFRMCEQTEGGKTRTTDGEKAEPLVSMRLRLIASGVVIAAVLALSSGHLADSRHRDDERQLSSTGHLCRSERDAGGRDQWFADRDPAGGHVRDDRPGRLREHPQFILGTAIFRQSRAVKGGPTYRSSSRTRPTWSNDNRVFSTFQTNTTIVGRRRATRARTASALISTVSSSSLVGRKKSCSAAR